ncbi:MAG TPA: GNAT family N-acetyltransferase [Verrucomicrobiae bacterium]|nr:GNAT family N-acetyltransferase [Verrucomicrobiae bacterium]
MTPAPAIRIVPATEESLDSISQLAGVIWRACYPGILSAEQIDYMLDRMYALNVLRDEITSAGIHYDLLLADDELIGFASYGLAAPATFKLHKLYLHPEYHGRGLGALLLRHCEEQAQGLGARKLVLNVNKNNSKAIATYQRCGFDIAKSVVTDIGGGFVMDDYMMEKVVI